MGAGPRRGRVGHWYHKPLMRTERRNAQANGGDVPGIYILFIYFSSKLIFTSGVGYFDRALISKQICVLRYCSSAGGRWFAIIRCCVAPAACSGKHGQDGVSANVARAGQQALGEGAAGPCPRVHGRLGRVRRQPAGKEGGLLWQLEKIRKGGYLALDPVICLGEKHLVSRAGAIFTGRTVGLKSSVTM